MKSQQLLQASRMIENGFVPAIYDLQVKIQHQW
jgi:hypothetical protein